MDVSNSSENTFDSFLSVSGGSNNDQLSDDSESLARPRVFKDYHLMTEFSNDEFPNFNDWFTEAKKGWQCKNKTTNSSGDAVHYYICSYNASPCQHKMKVIFSGSDLSVRIETTLDGEHSDFHEPKTKLTSGVKAKIVELHGLNLKPKVIRNRLLEIFHVDSVPSLKQVQNFVRRLKPKPKVLTDVDLEEYVARHSEQPADQNKPYVTSFMPWTDEQFVIVWTTPKLERIQSEANILATDATYKLSWHGFPIFIAGCFDVNNSFHPTYLAVASHEDTTCFTTFFNAIAQNATVLPDFVLADAARAITSSAEIVFPDSKRLMCWAHAIKNIDKKLAGLSVSNRKAICADIELLQYALSEEQFENACTVLINQWREDHGYDFAFANYFESEWVNSSHFRWFEGASPYPSTNNSLESLNKEIKASHSFRERFPFPQLTEFIEKMLEFDWSLGRSSPTDILLAIAPHVFADAYKLRESNRKVLSSSSNDKFLIPSNLFVALSKREIQSSALLAFNSEFESFEDYKAARFKVYTISKNGNVFSCNCPVGSKKKPCKHVILVECRLNLREYPPDARSQTIGQKRKRGAPKKSQTQRSTQSQNRRR